ncbi:OmpP1/FadL family transporter [Isoalcanivorax beigongshangi]|uniref:OmpP1/FadL family transporter n=1 Tax=Isoalcanivorax beigongshangi TaxID=3238810 RepID=A0ABV4AHQ9_9GAMM
MASAPVWASMGNAPSSYGILPGDVASAQSLSLFSSQISAVYYNPANLVKDRRGSLTLGMLHADHDLKADGRRIEDRPSQQLMLGLKTDLSRLTSSDHPIYFGLMAGVEKYGREMLSFSSNTQSGPQYLTYGRQPLFLTAGIGTQLWRGIDAGIAARVTLHAEAKLYAGTSLGGDTSGEQLEVSAKPVVRPIVGFNLRWGETFCDQAECWLDNLETALSYRASSNTRTKVRADITVPGVIQSPGLQMAIRAYDAMQPDITTLGFKYDFGGMRLGLTGEYQAWGKQQRDLRHDTIKDQGQINFRDIIIPRVGMEVDLSDSLMLTVGVARERSPLASTRTLDVNYIDANKTVFGLGLSAQIPRVPLLAWPVQLDLGYQYQHLDKRDFQLSSSATPGSYATVTTRGDVNVFVGSVSVNF